MMTRQQIEDFRSQLHAQLEGWHEETGILVPSEPDPAERRKTRLELRTAIYILSRVLGDIE